MEFNTHLVGKNYKKYGQNYIKVDDIKMGYNLGKAKLQFDNLFNGDNALGETMNSFLNDNWESLSEEVRPLLEEAMSEIVRSSADKLFEEYSLDDLLPE